MAAVEAEVRAIVRQLSPGIEADVECDPDPVAAVIAAFAAVAPEVSVRRGVGSQVVVTLGRRQPWQWLPLETWGRRRQDVGPDC